MAKVKPARASAIADFLRSPLCGNDIIVDQVTSLRTASSGALTFIQKYNENAVADLNRRLNVLVLADFSSASHLACSYIQVQDPRLAFARVAEHFFVEKTHSQIADTARISSDACLGDDVSVGHYSVIEANVHIGSGTVIADHVIIKSRTRIGKSCLIRSHAVIGESGFGFDFDDKVPVRIPHFGAVVIGDDVQVGCGSSISCGTLDDTIIENHVKIDDLVLVAHNCKVGTGAVITSGVVLCGRTEIGPYTWIGVNASIKEGGVKIGEGALVGLGSVVLKSVPMRDVVFGNPATKLRSRLEREEF